MTSHADVLNSVASVRAALIQRYKWFIHTTPEQFISDIRHDGLLPNCDAAAPEIVKRRFKADRVPILTLHPLGAKLCPRGAASTLVLPSGANDPKLVSLAIDAIDLPKNL